ncbi:Na+/H+ antiporter NhaA (plasmid) [Pantoea sp. JZ29]|uniref:Na+/H+ antiporter NhaA n=1 Tax=Pantoea sp. JZ29 TaxID=2654192 RepID=UPI002B46EA83|nr:Na+/H+ antiporter NhaA [Pantoea sp. JZ29]WRH22988.1 Na+/H+ antiporter NhaA [Pantoea sp. JZ29]
MKKLLHSPVAPGLLLIIVSLLAIALANSALAENYQHFVHASLFGLPVEKVVNDVLMSVFFLLVGLEIKRELLSGKLSSWSQRLLPGAAALGGMLVPAAFFIFFNRNNPQALNGWAIPSATDIAFSLGVLAMLGDKVPASLKVFLAALAIIDDLGAVVIIAAFYTHGLNLEMLTGAGIVTLCLIIMNRLGVKSLPLYLAAGGLLWYFVYSSGVHATVAGVILALCIPHTGRTHGQFSPLSRLEVTFSPWVAFLIVPVFGFVNAGVSLHGLSVEQLLSPLPVGIAAGLFAGKQLGVALVSWLLISTGLARIPEGATAAQFYGVAILCGIGFTMSLFIGGLAYPDNDVLQSELKIGVLSGSLLSALAGMIFLVIAGSARRPEQIA